MGRGRKSFGEVLGWAFLIGVAVITLPVLAAVGAFSLSRAAIVASEAEDPEQVLNPRTYPSPYATIEIASAEPELVPLVLRPRQPVAAPEAQPAPLPVPPPAVAAPAPPRLAPVPIPAPAPPPRAPTPATPPPAQPASLSVPTPAPPVTAPTVSVPARPIPPATSFLGLQTGARTDAVDLGGGRRLRLTALNPAINSWFLLYRDGVEGATLHIENPRPSDQRLSLSTEGLVVEVSGQRRVCPVVDAQGRDPFRDLQTPITPFCHGSLLLLSQRGGWRTRQEAVVSLLRSTGDLGERAIDFYKSTIGRDADLEVAQLAGGASTATGTTGLPASAAIDPQRRGARLARGRLGVATGGDGALEAGRWYPVDRAPGVAVSLMAANLVPAEVMASFPDRVAGLDEVEGPAVVRLVAFDLARHAIDFRLGTAHPSLEWSRRYEGAKPGAGPDGFASATPLARVGLVRPHELERLAGAFAAGFKREHGAFRAGPLAVVNQGSHYGFIEAGVVFSRLQPGLATLFATDDGRVHLRTWTAEDDALVPRIRFARQNGVPILQSREPHPFVRNWGNGNWSGALNPSGAGGILRSLRSAACLLVEGDRRWLVYAQFSAHTPNGMARVLQAYGCVEAMHLDMNSPDLTYAAVYRPDGSGGVVAGHVDNAMASSDPAGGLRFVSANDNRDFFVVLRR